jgi:hypothetical protein
MYFPRTGMDAILNYLVVGDGILVPHFLQELQVGLFSVPVVESYALTLAGITECTFTGYALRNLLTWVGGPSPEPPFSVSFGPEVHWFNTGVVTTTFYGAFLRNTFDLIQVDQFLSPVSLVVGAKFAYTPRVKMRSFDM